ncbi:MAG: 2-oxo acid dehydrogenase subunit E2 [Thermoflavifilum sp.]|nr:2-oxo acid dehydrogenase subunit E2 [Thermoflavifilum sp.]
MALVDLIMPKMGESIMEATILKWLKKPGDPVKQDEPVLEIATDKVDSEVPATVSGELAEILYEENQVVPVGAVIARIKTEQELPSADEAYDFHLEETPLGEAAPAAAQPEEEQPSSASTFTIQSTPSENTAGKANSGFFSPLVLMIAKNEGIPLAELEQIKGTGADGRVTKKDILDYVARRKTGKTTAESATWQQPQATARESLSVWQPAEKQTDRHVEIIEMDRMRKLIAEHMVRSKQTSPHVTSFAEADVTNLVQWRERIKKDFEKREGEKITFTPLFIEAIVKCIKRFPMLNSSVEGDKIIIKKDIHIGMATALPNGNLIVPVIKHADTLNLVGLVKQVNYLAQAARNNKLKPDDTQGGTFTLTNLGTFGSLMGTPIINQPQVAILATGLIKKRPVVIETPQGDTIGIRHMMYLSLSYDHRIIDGSLGATFLSAVAHELENFDPQREF